MRSFMVAHRSGRRWRVRFLRAKSKSLMCLVRFSCESLNYLIGKMSLRVDKKKLQYMSFITSSFVSNRPHSTHVAAKKTHNTGHHLKWEGNKTQYLYVRFACVPSTWQSVKACGRHLELGRQSDTHLDEMPNVQGKTRPCACGQILILIFMIRLKCWVEAFGQ